MEKEWIIELIQMFLVFFYSLLILQLMVTCLPRNFFDKDMTALLVYAFFVGLGEFLEHIGDGVKLTWALPDDEKKYDSLFIHYLRYIFLALICLVTPLFVCVMVYLIKYISELHNLQEANGDQPILI